MPRAKKQPIVVEPSRDAELCALVASRHDPDDILVYADWLEEQGDMPRASFLRKQQALRALKISNPRLLERGRELFNLGAKLPPEWIAAVTNPNITGSVWEGRDSDGELILRFLPTGFVNYTQPSGTFESGRWKQIGITVAMETNAHYADYFGVIIGDAIRGDAHNIVNYKWKWKVKLTSDPTIIAVPENTNRTIHDDHARPRRAEPKPTKPAAPKSKAKAKPKAKATPTRKKPLARKTPLKRRKSKT